MPVDVQSVPSGSDFDGNATSGEFLFNTVIQGDDTQRAELLTISVQCTEIMASIVVKIAPTLSDANDIEFAELINVETALGVQQVCCKCVVPHDWNVYVFTTGAATAEKKAILDWHAVTLFPRSS